MKPKRKAREAALQVLFQRGFQDTQNPEDLFNSFADNFDFEPATRDYALFLTTNVITKEEDLNTIITKYSDNWRLDRMALIDKILLQIATLELCFASEETSDPKICMTDIIDLAKKYSSEDSKNFINGILDQIYHQELGEG